MVRCKHCQEEARFVEIDTGNHKDIYFCPICVQKGYCPEDFEYEDEGQGLKPGDAYKYSGKSIMWVDFWAESRIEELEERVSQLEEQLADTGRDDPELKCPYCNDKIKTDQEYMDDTFGPNWREYVKDEDVSIYCSGCGRAWVADELIE